MKHYLRRENKSDEKYCIDMLRDITIYVNIDA